VKFNDVLEVGRACADRGLALGPTARREAAGRVAALAEKHGSKITGTLLDMHRFAERILAGTAEPYPQGSRGCGAMRGQMCIWPDGRVTPCDRIPHETMGSVLESTLEEIWRGEAARRFREMLAAPIDELPDCRECEHLPYCTGGCPVLPMRDSGEILGRDPGGCIRAFLGEEVAHG
jgi:radical SAM protein with 4Fe4S-binding SPASM domain